MFAIHSDYSGIGSGIGIALDLTDTNFTRTLTAFAEHGIMADIT